jgi:hypothetical protein
MQHGNNSAIAAARCKSRVHSVYGKVLLQTYKKHPCEGSGGRTLFARE